MSSVDIAFLVPDLRGGGAERVVVNLANTYAARGFAVECILMRAAGEFLHELAPDVRVVVLDAARLRSALVPLVGHLRATQPRALVASMWPLTIIAIVARALARVPTRVLVVEHTTLSVSAELTNRTPAWLVFLTLRLFYPRADRIITVSRGAADDMIEHASLAHDAVTVIHNPIIAGAPAIGDGQVLEAARAWSESATRLIAIGTLKDQKRFGVLLEAFCILRAARPARLLILGDGPLRAALERRAAELGIASDLCMPGFVLDPTPYLRRADLFVLSSAWEGFGNVIVEALAQGVPVVSTDCPSGPSEILEGGAFGRLVPVDHPDALAAAMLATLDEPVDRERLRRRAMHFSVARAADAYLAAIGDAVQRTEAGT